jgi:hypothetical protein
VGDHSAFAVVGVHERWSLLGLRVLMLVLVSVWMVQGCLLGQVEAGWLVAALSEVSHLLVYLVSSAMLMLVHLVASEGL